MRNLWSAVSSRLRFVSRVSEVVRVDHGDGRVFVYCVPGLGFGSSVTVVVRLDEPSRGASPGGGVAEVRPR